MNSNKFSECIDIKGEAAQLFDYTQDYNNRLTWDTFLIKAHLLDNVTHAAKGVNAWCVSKSGLGMETQYVSFNRPKVTAIKMTKGPYMFKEFAASWTFSEDSDGITTVTFLYTFKLRFPFNWVSVVIKNTLRKNVRKRLKDLKDRFTERNSIGN
jgi:ribosome-associated toxin RatA of RatAB toxin-antitoxin module